MTFARFIIPFVVLPVIAGLCAGVAFFIQEIGR